MTPATCGTHANTSSLAAAALLPLAAAAAGTVCASARTARLEWEEAGHQQYVHTATYTIKSSCPEKLPQSAAPLLSHFETTTRAVGSFFKASLKPCCCFHDHHRRCRRLRRPLYERHGASAPPGCCAMPLFDQQLFSPLRCCRRLRLRVRRTRLSTRAAIELFVDFSHSS